MTIRPATPSDAAQIAAIWNAEIREGVSTFNSVEKTQAEVVELIHARPSCFLIAEMDAQVVGFASFSQFRGGIGYAATMEHTIYLAPVVRGRGVGRALMVALEDIARTQGVHVLVAGIGAENSSAVAFHAALGFVEAGRMAQVGRKFDRWMDLALMQKIL